MRARNLVPVAFVVAGAVAAFACSGSKSTSPSNNNNNNNGSTSSANESDTITASSTNGGYNTTYSFSPTPDTVSSGTTVSYKFEDVQHTVIWDTQGAPDSIPPTSNAVVQLTFSTAGSYNYHCRIHTYMTGTVVVK